MSLPGRFLGATLVALTVVSLGVRWLLAQLSPASLRALEDAAEPFGDPVATVVTFVILLVLVAVAAAYMTIGPDYSPPHWRGR